MNRMPFRMPRLSLFFALAGALTAQTAGGNGCAADGTVVNSATGEPIPRARVMANSGGAIATATTDTQGRWAVEGLLCGAFQVSAGRPGFINPMQTQMAHRVNFRSMSISAGAPLHGLKIELTPQSVVVGKVSDEQGDPLQGANILVMTSRVIEGKRQFQPAGGTTANDLGEYRAANLAPGKYIICVQVNPTTMNGGSFRGGMAPARPALENIYGENCYPGPIESGAGSPLELPAGHEERVDFSMAPTSAVHVRGSFGGLAQGKHAGVNLMKRGTNRGFGMSHLPVTITPDGGFDIAGVLPGSYIASADSWEPNKRLSARVPVEVGTSDVNGLVLQMEPGIVIRGNVRVESASGASPKGPPMNLAHLRAADSVFAGGQFKWNEDNRSFTITDVNPGSYLVEVFPNQGLYVKSATASGQDVLHSEMPFQQSNAIIDIVLSDRVGSLEGTVTGSDGQPAQGPILLIRAAGERPVTLFSGPDGHFKQPSVAPGDYTAYAFDDLNQVEYANEEWMKRNGSNGVRVTIGEAQSAQVQLKQQIVAAQ